MVLLLDAIDYDQSCADSVSPEDLSIRAEYEKRVTAWNCSSVSESKKFKPRNDFHIRTLINGNNSGRVYYLKASNEIEREEIVRKLSESVLSCPAAHSFRTTIFLSGIKDIIIQAESLGGRSESAGPRSRIPQAFQGTIQIYAAC